MTVGDEAMVGIHFRGESNADGGYDWEMKG